MRLRGKAIPLKKPLNRTSRAIPGVRRPSQSPPNANFSLQSPMIRRLTVGQVLERKLALMQVQGSKPSCWNFSSPLFPVERFRHVKSDPLSACTPQLCFFLTGNPERLPDLRYLEIFAYEIFPGSWDPRAVCLLHKIPSSDDGDDVRRATPKIGA